MPKLNTCAIKKYNFSHNFRALHEFDMELTLAKPWRAILNLDTKGFKKKGWCKT